MTTLNIKPLSVNDAWRGKRFKTDDYKKYERNVTYLLPHLKLPEPPYKIYFEFGLSSVLSDWDNPIKPTQDIICKKYGINDKHIFEANIKKVKVEKGEEYIKFQLSSI